MTERLRHKISDIRIYDNLGSSKNAPPFYCRGSLISIPFCFVMHLRERGFSLGKADHLYINIESIGESNGVRLTEESKEFSHRVRSVSIEMPTFVENATYKEQYSYLVHTITRCLEFVCNALDIDSTVISETSKIILEHNGEQMIVLKEKENRNYKATVVFRCHQSIDPDKPDAYNVHAFLKVLEKSSGRTGIQEFFDGSHDVLKALVDRILIMPDGVTFRPKTSDRAVLYLKEFYRDYKIIPTIKFNEILG